MTTTDSTGDARHIPGETWTRLPGTDVEVRHRLDRVIPLRYRRVTDPVPGEGRCVWCGHTRSPMHDADAPGPTVRHPYTRPDPDDIPTRNP